MSRKLAASIFLGIIALCLIAGAYLYPFFPERVASHWNSLGEVNGYMNRFMGVFLLPMIMCFIFVVYLVIPKIEPMKDNLESFDSYYNSFWVTMALFLAYVYALTLYWNLGHVFNFSVAIIPAFSVLWFMSGILLRHAKRNWFVGVRTPWTLYSDVVWDKTHKVSAKLFQGTAIITLFGIFFSHYAIWFVMIPLFASLIISVGYSYFLYRKIQVQ